MLGGGLEGREPQEGIAGEPRRSLHLLTPSTWSWVGLGSSFQPHGRSEPQFPFCTGGHLPACPAGGQVALWTQLLPPHTAGSWLPALGSKGLGSQARLTLLHVLGASGMHSSPKAPRSAMLPPAHVSRSRWEPEAAAQTPEFRAGQTTGTLEVGNCPTSDKTGLGGGEDSGCQPAAHMALESCLQTPSTLRPRGAQKQLRPGWGAGVPSPIRDGGKSGHPLHQLPPLQKQR